MSVLFTLFIAILPVYLIGLYIYNKDRFKEPKTLLKKLFIYGMISCIPAAILELILEPLFGAREEMDLFTLFIYTSLSIALVEEFFKWLFTYKIAFYHKEFDEIYDAIVYAVFTSLGFACFENIFYVLDSGIGTGILRAVTAVPAHAADAIIMGHYLGLAKIADLNQNKPLCKKNLILSILMPTIIHAIYDYCLLSHNYILVSLFMLFVIYLYIISIKRIKYISSNNHYLTKREVKYCPNCGSREGGNYCTKCGTNLRINPQNNLTQ